uniref:Uncharacterized protein n=1 Tax=Sphaerodactylus townsendi TaxID=933632 RepID=A0ACB8ECE1_9SAUR
MLCRLLSRFSRAVRLPEGELSVPGRSCPEAPARPLQTDEAPPPLPEHQETGRRLVTFGCHVVTLSKANSSDDLLYNITLKRCLKDGI